MADEAETQRLLGNVTGELKGLRDLVTATLAELTRQIADTNEQAHEIKHDQRNQLVAFAGVNERLKAQAEVLKGHIETDENTKREQMAAITENRRVTQETIRDSNERIAGELAAYRTHQAEELTSHQTAITASMQTIKDNQTVSMGKLDDLILWRGKLLGGVTVVGAALTMLGIILGIFGRFIFDQAMSLWHTVKP